MGRGLNPKPRLLKLWGLRINRVLARVQRGLQQVVNRRVGYLAQSTPVDEAFWRHCFGAVSNGAQ